MKTGQIKVSSILITVAGILVFYAFVHVVSFVLFRIYGRPSIQSQSSTESNFRKSNVQLKGPFLQTAPAQDLAALRKHEDEILNSYGWEDRRQGMIRIPVRKAMDIMVNGKGLQ